MGFTTICKYIHFITIIAIVSGYAHDLTPKLKRPVILQDTMTDLTHYPGVQYFPTRNAKRMTMDENTRARGAWGQMSPQYYQAPAQGQYPNQYYPGPPQNYQQEYPTTTGTAINIYKGMGGDKNKPKLPGSQQKEQDDPNHGDPTGYSALGPKKKVKVLICKLHQERN